MINIKLNFNKKVVPATLENIQSKKISPYRDWISMLIISAIIIALSAIYSAFLFYKLLEEDDFQPEARSQISAGQFVDINVSKLNSAADFINSRM